MGAAFCSSTPSSSWSNNPECCGCGAAKSLLEEQNNSSELAVAQPAAVGAPAMPAWCQYVPTGLAVQLAGAAVPPAALVQPSARAHQAALGRTTPSAAAAVQRRACWKNKTTRASWR